MNESRSDLRSMDEGRYSGLKNEVTHDRSNLRSSAPLQTREHNAKNQRRRKEEEGIQSLSTLVLSTTLACRGSDICCTGQGIGPPVQAKPHQDRTPGSL